MEQKGPEIQILNEHIKDNKDGRIFYFDVEIQNIKLPISCTENSNKWYFNDQEKTLDEISEELNLLEDELKNIISHTVVIVKSAYQKKKYEEKRVIKNISFNVEKDAKLLEEVNKTPNFNKYVKKLLKKELLGGKV